MDEIRVAALINTDGEILEDGTDTFRVVITAGKDDGIREGQRVQFFRYGADIIDPRNNSSLGKLEISLGTGKVYLSQDNMSTVTSDMTRRNTSTLMAGLKMVGEPEYISVPFTKVKVGDYVKLI